MNDGLAELKRGSGRRHSSPPAFTGASKFLESLKDEDATGRESI
jgi:hypothetical protein